MKSMGRQRHIFYDQLTEREKTIVRMASSGYRVQEIADQIGVSRPVVGLAKHRLCKKMAVTNLTELVHLLHRAGVYDAATAPDDDIDPCDEKGRFTYMPPEEEIIATVSK